MASREESLHQVERANTRFYRAFESLDMVQMAAVWVQAERTTCVHPGWDVLCGWEAVQQSWEAIFASTDYMRFIISDVAIVLYDQVAWVTCVENLSHDPEVPQVSRLLATNVYERHGEDWQIVHHHASPVLRPMANRQGPGPETLN
jgi:ketosteroid isomerase-like protein